MLTGQLGTPLSSLGNVELGFVPSGSQTGTSPMQIGPGSASACDVFPSDAFVCTVSPLDAAACTITAGNAAVNPRTP